MQETDILRFLIQTAVRVPKFTIAVALLVLIALASTMTYVGFQVVGVVAELLGTGRVIAGLLLGLVFARFPRFSGGKLSTVGLLPKVARRPIMLSLLAFCMASFFMRGDYVPAGFIGFAAVFLLTFPWLRRRMMGRLMSNIFKPPMDQARPRNDDDNVIDVEFKEKKD